MTEREAFERRIAAEPEEDTHRVVFADWLDEQAEPEDIARAEFIRIQMQLSKCQGIQTPLTIQMARRYALGEWKNPPLETRAACLLSEFATAWCQGFGIPGVDAATAHEWGWLRGFVCSVPCALSVLEWERSQAIVKSLPVTRFVVGKEPYASPIYPPSGPVTAFVYGWCDHHNTAGATSHIGPALFSLLPDHGQSKISRTQHFKFYLNRDAAIDALAVAAGRLVRDHVYAQPQGA